jgi:raffinose/stachyose/melibiose transport system substrate-binding protein
MHQRHEHRTRRSGRGIVKAALGALLGSSMSLGLLIGTGGLSAASSSTTLTIFVHTEPAIDAVFAKLDAAFEQAHPGVTVSLQTVPSNDLEADQATRLAAGNIDITEGPFLGIDAKENPSYVTGPESSFVTGVKAGDWVNLSNQSFLKNFEPSVIRQLSENGKVYAIPSGLDYYTGVFYSKAIFAKYHLSIPRTWSQFLAVCKTLKAAGVSPLLIGGKDTWPAGLVMQAVVHALYTPSQQQAFVKGLWEGQDLLTTAKAVEVLDRIQTIYSYVTPNFPGIAYAEVPALFSAGQAAMVPDGTWDQPTIQAANPKFQFGYFPLPAGDTAASNAYLGGKLDISYSIPSNSKHIALAEEWIAMYSSPKWYQEYIAGSGFIPVEPNIKSTAFVNSLKPYEAPGGFSLAWDQVFFGNTKSGTLSANPFDYEGVAPMGSYTNMKQLAAAEQQNWNSSLKEVSKK